MLIRIVKMSFKSDEIDTFLDYFHGSKTKIRNFKGCQRLELYRDKSDQHIFFTYSFWKSPEDLENYRNSDLFKSVWAKTKKLFNEKAVAWSVDKIVCLD